MVRVDLIVDNPAQAGFYASQTGCVLPLLVGSACEVPPASGQVAAAIPIDLGVTVTGISSGVIGCTYGAFLVYPVPELATSPLRLVTTPCLVNERIVVYVNNTGQHAYTLEEGDKLVGAMFDGTSIQVNVFGLHQQQQQQCQRQGPTMSSPPAPFSSPGPHGPPSPWPKPMIWADEDDGPGSSSIDASLPRPIHRPPSVYHQNNQPTPTTPYSSPVFDHLHPPPMPPMMPGRGGGRGSSRRGRSPRGGPSSTTGRPEPARH